MPNLLNRLLRRRNRPDYPPGVVSMDSVIDTGEILMGPGDMFGRPIQVFSQVVYPAAYQRNKTQMAAGHVTQILPDGGLIIEVTVRSREDSVKRSLVRLSAMGARNVVVIG